LHPYQRKKKEEGKKKIEKTVWLFFFLSSLFSLLSFPGGIFLWHYPHDRSHWALPSKSGLSGARTFLKGSHPRNSLADSSD
jgi:hypothetical protein